MTHWRWILFVLLLPGVAQAETFVCGTSAQRTRFFQADPTKVPEATGPTPSCFQIPKAQTPAQRTLLESTPLRYLKVTSGLAEEKTQAEKDAVDAAMAAQQAAAQVLRDELTTQNNFCNPASLAEVNTRILQVHDNLRDAIQTRHAAVQTSIDGIAAANLTTLKAGLSGVNTATVTSLNDLNDTYALAIQKIVRCFRAFRGAP